MFHIPIPPLCPATQVMGKDQFHKRGTEGDFKNGDKVRKKR